MTNYQFDDPMKELEAALAIEPSPAFAARVRIAVDARSRSTLGMWAWAGAAGALAAALVTLSVWTGRMAEPVTPPAGLSSREMVRPAEPHRLPDAAAPAVEAPKITAAVEAFERSGPDLVVITNQPAVLRAMWNSVESGRISSVPETALDELAHREPEVSKVLTITALSIPKLVIAPIDSDDKE